MNPRPIQEARRRSRSSSPTSEPGMCLREVRECFGVPARADDAAEAWHQAQHQHHETNPQKIPRGVPVFWLGGSAGHGHVAISTGFAGRCFSTDIRRPGYFDQVPIEEIGEKWGLELVGWTEDLNGVRVWTDPRWVPAKTEPEPKPARAKKTTARKRAAKKGASR